MLSCLEIPQESIAAGRAKVKEIDEDLRECPDPRVLTDGNFFWIVYGPRAELTPESTLPRRRTGPFYSMAKACAWFSGGGR